MFFFLSLNLTQEFCCVICQAHLRPTNWVWHSWLRALTQREQHESQFKYKKKKKYRSVLGFHVFLLSVLLHVYNSCYALMGICLQGVVWANVPALLNKGIRADRLIITSLGHTGYILLQYPFAKHHMSWRLLLQYIITVMLQDLLATSKTQTRQLLQNVLIRRLQWPICPLSLVPNHLYWSLPTDFKQPLLTVYSF